MKRKLKKLNLKIGAIYIEPYDCETNEERGRSKIYDSLGHYISYISTENLTKEQYNNILCEYLLSKDIQDFIENKLLVESYDYDTDLGQILYSMFDMVEDDFFEQLENDIKIKSEEGLMEKYDINKVGEWYFNIND